MKYIAKLVSHLCPIRTLLTILLSALLFFGSHSSALADKSPPEGTVQLDKIEQKTREAIDSPAGSMKAIEKRTEGGLNEIQGTADRDKMIHSNDTQLPAVKQAEKAINKNRNN